MNRVWIRSYAIYYMTFYMLPSSASLMVSFLHYVDCQTCYAKEALCVFVTTL
jgi:hypothetical protein